MPTAKGERPRDDRQAVLAEPPMLVQLEKAIEAQCQVGDPRWMDLLGQWMQASACMRCVHLTRSDVLAFTGSTVHVLGQASFAMQVYSGLLFGLPLAVTSFNRLSRFTEAVGRRLTGTMVSMYFDGALSLIWARPRVQVSTPFGEVNRLMGSPFATEKRRAMASSGTSLVLTGTLRS